jgi:hypothetical protein
MKANERDDRLRLIELVLQPMRRAEGELRSVQLIVVMQRFIFVPGCTRERLHQSLPHGFQRWR